MQFRTVKSVAADILLARPFRPLGRHIMEAKALVNEKNFDLFKFHQEEILATRGAAWLDRVNKALGDIQIF